MKTNTYELTIQAPIEHVWHCLTDKDICYQWLNRIKIETDYQKGSTITFKAYGIQDKIALSWRGVIETIEPNRELTINYKGYNNLLGASYQLQPTNNNTTYLIMTEECITYDAANQLSRSTQRALNRLKGIAEKA